MNKLIMMIGAAAIAPLAGFAAWEGPYTTTIDGITYKYLVDTTNAKIQLGAYDTDVAQADSCMIDTTTSGVLYLPATITHEGTAYNVTDFGQWGLCGCSKLTGVVIPETSFAHATGLACFQNMTNLKAFWWKGPTTVSSGEQPVSRSGATTYMFRNDANLRAVVLGPNVTRHSIGAAGNTIFSGCSGVYAFVPKARWSDVSDIVFGGTNCKVIRYGAGEDIDVSIDGTFTVATSNRLDDVLSVANYLHDYCGMNPKINVTNTIEVADVSITSEKLAYLDSGTFNSLVFKVNTQTQLDALLAAVPSTIPFAINPADAKDTLTVPQGREVYVKLSAEGKQGRYTPKINGLIISFF